LNFWAVKTFGGFHGRGTEGPVPEHRGSGGRGEAGAGAGGQQGQVGPGERPETVAEAPEEGGGDAREACGCRTQGGGGRKEECSRRGRRWRAQGCVPYAVAAAHTPWAAVEEERRAAVASGLAAQRVVLLLGCLRGVGPRPGFHWESGEGPVGADGCVEARQNYG